MTDSDINVIRDAMKAAQADPWRDAVLAELDSYGISSPALDADPRAAVKELLHWNQTVALDPAVSSDAQALIDRGRAEAAVPAAPAPAPTTIYALASQSLMQEIDYGINHGWPQKTLERLRDMRAAIRTQALAAPAAPAPIRQVVPLGFSTWEQLARHLQAENERLGRCIDAKTTAAAPAAVPVDWLLRSRVVDLLHLLEFSALRTATGTDDAQARKVMADLRAMLKAPAVAAPEPTDDAMLRAVNMCWNDDEKANKTVTLSPQQFCRAVRRVNAVLAAPTTQEPQ